MKYFFVFFVFACTNLKITFTQQVSITLQEASTGEIIPYANVCIKTLGVESKKIYKLTDNQGITRIPLLSGKQVAITASSLGFKTLTDTITLKNENTFTLEEDLFNVEQVVVTGEVKPTLADNSIYQIKTITAKEITSSGSTNLSDVLLTKPNIRITTDKTLGSQIEMMGMTGENVKVMIDGVPVIGRLDGNIDLSQVNIANTDHIEIVEGPMSVIYGNNALAGTINIITKTGVQNQQGGQIATQIENVGKYSGNIAFVKPLGNHSLSFDGSGYYFDGVDFDTETRSMDWRPASNCQAGIGYKWGNDNWKVTAKTNGSYNTLLIKSDISSTFMVYDTYYYTRRFDQSLGANGTWNENNYLNVLAYYSYYDRASQEYDKDLTTLEGTWLEKETSQNFQNKETRAIYGYSFPTINLELKTGIDLKNESMGGPRVDSSTYEAMGDYAAFLTFNYKITDKIELQPGARYAYNTAFDHPLVYSVNVKYTIAPAIIWRTSFAKGFRAPSLKELYYNFTELGHDVHGNSNLKAEHSQYVNTTFEIKPTCKVKINTSLFYNHLHNKIDLVENSTVRSGYYAYYNIDLYKSLGSNLSILFIPNTKLKINIGTSLTGRYNEYSEENNSENFNFSPDFFAGVQALESFTKIQCHVDYKYNGVKPYFLEDDDGSIVEGQQEAYHLLNVSLSRSFFKKHLQTSLGIRNLMDVTSVKTTSESSGHSSTSSTAITYGRSCYIQLAYTF